MPLACGGRKAAIIKSGEIRKGEWAMKIAALLAVGLMFPSMHWLSSRLEKQALLKISVIGLFM